MRSKKEQNRSEPEQRENTAAARASRERSPAAARAYPAFPDSPPPPKRQSGYLPQNQGFTAPGQCKPGFPAAPDGTPDRRAAAQSGPRLCAGWIRQNHPAWSVGLTLSGADCLGIAGRRRQRPGQVFSQHHCRHSNPAPGFCRRGPGNAAFNQNPNR